MRIAVLGGLGLQGRAAIADLVASSDAEEIICVDTSADGPARLGGLTDLARVRFVVPEGAIGPSLQSVGVTQGYYFFNAAPYILTLLLMVASGRSKRAARDIPRELAITR